ncbi:hypothetical protein PCE1_002343 [Barthelona sp. PCE]
MTKRSISELGSAEFHITKTFQPVSVQAALPRYSVKQMSLDLSKSRRNSLVHHRNRPKSRNFRSASSMSQNSNRESSSRRMVRPKTAPNAIMVPDISTKSTIAAKTAQGSRQKISKALRHTFTAENKINLGNEDDLMRHKRKRGGEKGFYVVDELPLENLNRKDRVKPSSRQQFRSKAVDFEVWLTERLVQLKAKDQQPCVIRIRVFRELFDRIIAEGGTYSTLLQQIKDEYEANAYYSSNSTESTKMSSGAGLLIGQSGGSVATDDLQRQNEDLLFELTKTKHQLEDLNEEHLSLKRKQEETQRQNVTYSMRVESLENQLDRLNSEIDTLRKQNMDLAYSHAAATTSTNVLLMSSTLEEEEIKDEQIREVLKSRIEFQYK